MHITVFQVAFLCRFTKNVLINDTCLKHNEGTVLLNGGPYYRIGLANERIHETLAFFKMLNGILNKDMTKDQCKFDIRSTLTQDQNKLNKSYAEV